MERKNQRRFGWIVAAMAVGVGIVTGGNGLLVAAPEAHLVTMKTSERGFAADSIADIITEMKNGDRSRTKSLGDAFRYGHGVEKSMLNAMICFQMADYDFVAEARKTYGKNPDDEFARLFILMNMYDNHYLEDAEELLSGITQPAPAWVGMMRRIIKYDGSDINGYILSLIGPDSSTDECFLAFACYLSNNKESNDVSALNDLLKTLCDKVPYFYNRTGDMKLEEYSGNPDAGLLKDAVVDFKKANDFGFLTARHARRILAEDIRSNVALDSIFTAGELEQLKRLAASTSPEYDHAEVAEMTSPDEVVELIESMTIEEVFNMTASFDGFEEVKDVYDLFNFPKEIGDPTMIAHGNADHRESILGLLELLPEGSMVYDDTDGQGRFDRLFLDADSNDLLYVHVGINGNDTVLILFQGGDRGDIDKFIDELNTQ